jgi:hypothetical protein
MSGLLAYCHGDLYILHIIDKDIAFPVVGAALTISSFL